MSIPKTKNGEELVHPMIEPLKALLQELPRSQNALPAAFQSQRKEVG
jgi:hypothetical protein